MVENLLEYVLSNQSESNIWYNTGIILVVYLWVVHWLSVNLLLTNKDYWTVSWGHLQLCIKSFISKSEAI